MHFFRPAVGGVRAVKYGTRSKSPFAGKRLHFFENAFEGLSMGHSALLPDHLAIFENNEGGDVTYLKTGHERFVSQRIDIDFNNVRGVADEVVQLVENRVHHPARAAPRGIKLNKSGDRASDQFIKLIHL